jgi:predicted MPP superfamily phosphohydrolase
VSIFSLILLSLVLSQLYWAWALRGWLNRRFPGTLIRHILLAAALVVYFLLLSFNVLLFRYVGTPVRLTPAHALFGAPFLCWIACSYVAFFVAIAVAIVRGIGRLGRWAAGALRKPAAAEAPASAARRHFLERAAVAVTAAPFVAGAYGLFYGRLNLQTPVQRIRLPRLPKEFEGFRIAQLSDIHIGPYMPEEEIRRYAEIANALKPDLTVLTGDFVTFDGSTQYAVVKALSGLRAPFGVFGCLGNHDAWSRVQDSITRLFRQAGIRILRYQRAPIFRGAAALNLIGVDFESPHRFGPSMGVPRVLSRAEDLKLPDHVNILLSHNPDTFPRAAEIGFDLSLAGHTHGGQAALEFISPEIAPSRLVTPYVSGLFEKPGAQLYVNRGIGTIGVPIRIGAPPEITVFELRKS